MGSVHAKSLEEIPVENTNRLENLDILKARVDKVHVDGLGRTKDDVIVKSVKGLFDAQTFQEVLLKAHEARHQLEHLGSFKNIGIYIDTSKGSKDGFEVTFFVREMKRMLGGINTLIGNNEGSLVLGGRLPNTFGRGERIQAEYAYGTKHTSGFNLTFSKPLLYSHSANASVTSALFQQSGEMIWSGFRETDRGLLVETAFESAPKVRHNLRWEGVWRELSILPGSSSFDIREEMGHSLKSSLKHTLTYDQRDAAIFPNQGLLFRMIQELAGLGGDIGFLKHEVEVQANMPLPFDCVLQGGFMGGVLQQRNEKACNIADRFFLGGPMTLRGFETRGAGPHSEGFALGADCYWATAAHLYTPLPFRPGRGGLGEYFRLHFFANAGNIGNFQFGEDYQHAAPFLFEHLRSAYGAGLVLQLGRIARLELNYCVPLSLSSGDRACHGVQIGVGIMYL